MAQSWTDDVYASGHVGDTDLQNMENNFTAIKSMFSGGSAPSNAVAGMPWFDTTQKVQKQRNTANSAWIGLMHGDTSEKRLVYRDAAMDGYARDSGVTDKVIALKGGSTYTTGAATAGTWTIDNHTLVAGEIPAHVHTIAARTSRGARASGVTTEPEFYLNDTTVNTGSYGGSGGHGHTFGTGTRIAAAVCILIYLDL